MAILVPFDLISDLRRDLPPDDQLPPTAIIFQHGFSTRAEGRGFGLHSSSIAANDMGGVLDAHSDGPNQGALFTLIFPWIGDAPDQTTPPVERRDSIRIGAAVS